MRARWWILVALCVTPLLAQAQVRPEIRPFVGVYVPTGHQSDMFRSAVLTGAQGAVELAERFHVVGTFAFAGPSFRPSQALQGHTHIFQGDLGMETFAIRPMADEWQFRPFVGLGAGVRTYDFTGPDPAVHYATAYGSAGAELQNRNCAVRTEVRDYVTRFRGVTGNDAVKARNEIGISVGLARHF